MRGNEMLDVLEFIAPEYIEAADELPDKTKIKAFKPWLKWVAAAVAIAVIAGGTPFALKAIGSFRNESFVAPNGSGNSGIVAPVDSGEPESSEPENSSAPDSENNPSSEQSGESRPHGSEAPGGSSTERPDDPTSSSGTPSGSDVTEQTEGEFVKDNMPAVTYRINGEYKTFDYQSSTAVVESGSSYVIDHYVGADGSKIATNAVTGELVQYKAVIINDYYDELISEKEAIEIAKLDALCTDIAFGGLENASTSIQSSEDGYRILLTTTEGNAEILLDISGKLLSLTIRKNT